MIKRIIVVVLLTVAVGFIAGCGEKEKPTTTTPATPPVSEVEKVAKEKTTEAKKAIDEAADKSKKEVDKKADEAKKALDKVGK